MSSRLEGACGGGHNIMPKGLGFVLDAKSGKTYLKSRKCKKNDHNHCGGHRTGNSRGYMKCECPCHTLEMDPNL